jgi:alkyldihydroxyacetonephosphate synthase
MDSFRTTHLAADLAGIVGSKYVVTAEADRFIYGVDYYWVPRMLVDRGLTPALPDVVVLPGSVDELAEVIKLANIQAVPVIPWGGGSGTQGGVIPLLGGITIDLKRLCRLVDVNATSQTVTAQAGINGFDLECKLNALGYQERGSQPRFSPLS